MSGMSALKISLSIKFLLAVILTLIAGLSIMLAFVSRNSQEIAETMSLKGGEELGRRIAADIKRDLDGAMGVTVTIRDAFIGLYNNGNKDRNTYLKILESAVIANPQYVAIWTAWEPNAFDGKDAEFINADGKATFENAKAHDTTGRFVPYVFSTGNGFDITPLTEYDKSGPGDYYLLAKNSGKQQIIEPYPYVVGDKTVIMTSLVTPIIVDGVVKGVVGLDLDLAGIQQHLANIKPYETGTVSLISQQGNWAAFAELDQLMKPIEGGLPSINNAKARILKGETFSFIDDSPSEGPALRLLNPVTIGTTGTSWSVMVTLPLERVLTSARDMTLYNIFAASILILILAIVVSGLIYRIVSSPLRLLTKSIHILAEGNTKLEVPLQSRQDELGIMAKAIEFFRQRLSEMDNLRQKSAAAEKETETQKKQLLFELAKNFEASVRNVVESVTRSSLELENNAHSMNKVVSQANSEIELANQSTSHATDSVTNVAAAAEELTSSIAEIARQVTHSAQSAGSAVTEVDKTGSTISDLAMAAQEIGGIVSMIADIAAQTNLLALNATIEAARAGDAGKGFAVVAAEVKNLASQTGKAAEDITQRIQRIQATTDQAVGAMNSVKSAIGQVNEIAATIAAAVEEQSAATKEISNSANKAIGGTEEVTQNIQQVAKATGDSGKAAQSVLKACGHLTQQAEHLRGEIDSFILKIKAG